ncbi:extracellular solute-binding protein [uncultured Desulfosarcina sp.]|uniref:extracellular solute-binding protein n=1 Tax=uncultured Desulfosarcina sp. TaxID=218289 RepID=UPI0029C69CEB|nr:extracellular solute-binding protein [uncultured Desulfosarcina sp.]
MTNFIKSIIVAFIVLSFVQPVHSKTKDKLTIVSWGGAFTKSNILAQVEPYEEETGVEVEVLDYNGGLKEIRAQVSSYNTKWDLVDMYLPDVIRASKEGLLEKIDISSMPYAPDGTAAQKDFIEGTLTDYAVGNTVSANVFVYKNNTFTKKQPETIQDFFDINAFPGKRGLRSSARINLEWALIADGVPLNEVYKTLTKKEGLERAFKKLDSIKSHIVWWESGAEPIEFLDEGRVVMTSAWNGRVQSAIDGGKDLTIIWDGQVWEFDLWCIPKRTRDENLNQIMDFLKFATDTQRLADLTKYIAYSPARKSSFESLSPAVKEKLPTATKNSKNSLKLDGMWWAENQQKMDEAFQHWKALKGWSFGGGLRP